jgi:hypothetical protein
MVEDRKLEPSIEISMKIGKSKPKPIQDFQSQVRDGQGTKTGPGTVPRLVTKLGGKSSSSTESEEVIRRSRRLQEKAAMAAEHTQYYDGTGGLHPFEAGFPWAALSKAQLNRLRRGVQAMDVQGMEKTKSELKARFCTPEVGELAPHVLPQLIWPSRDSELFLKPYGVKLLDPKWLTTPVLRPAVPELNGWA